MRRGFLRRHGAAMALAALWPLGAAAQDGVTLDGVYSSEPACASGYDPLSGTRSYLVNDGIEALEGGCFFLEKTADDVGNHQNAGFNGFVAIGYCQEPGLTTPHLFHVRPHADLADGGRTVMVIYQDGATTHEVEYYPCAAP